MSSSGRAGRAEIVVIALYCAWLVWIPLPFGSVVAAARLPLVAVPVVLCIAAAALRLVAARDRNSTGHPTIPWLIWSAGAAALVLLGVIQVMPLPRALVAALSPEAGEIWSRAAAIASHAGIPARAFRLSVDPAVTADETFRLAGIAASFLTASLLIRSHQRRQALAVVLATAGVFEAIYGLREAALQRYEIWGWVNRLIFDRVTGTFVNPNHFAHYLAVVLPLPLFLVAVEWHRAGSERTPATVRLVRLFEVAALRTGLALLAAVACAAGMLLAQSRGALLSLGVGLLTAVAIMPGRRLFKIAATAGAGIVLVVALVVFLGPERTVRRFVPLPEHVNTLVGRRIGIATAARVWERFPLFGSGLGTFERVVSMEQRESLDSIYHHAHNDYLELAATGGIAGAAVGFAALLGGWIALWRMTAGVKSEELTWKRRAWQIAALASLTVAMVHALFDFNFYIPSNPATLAAILGAAAASLDHDRRVVRPVTAGEPGAARRSG